MPLIKARVRTDIKYLLQYLDLAKLAQGICSNVRAVGEHVEYEADTWISASLLTRELNELSQQLMDSYKHTPGPESYDPYLADALRQTTISTLLVSAGLASDRFEQNEIKGFVRFHELPDIAQASVPLKVVHFDVHSGALSFHHPMHYTLSWLVQHGKHSWHTIKLLQEFANELVAKFQANKDSNNHIRLHELYETGEDALLALFDYPLRVGAWLAQMRVNLWIRNGMSLKHQMSQYRSASHRDVGYHRDIVLLQTALITINPERVLASMIDRYGLVPWLCGRRAYVPEIDTGKIFDIAEDFLYLLINLLSDRDHFVEQADETKPDTHTTRRDIAHVLCFKPLSYSDIVGRMTRKTHEKEGFAEALKDMTTYKPPEGLSDSGLFELKPDCLAEIDPYNFNFSRNQRDEAENVYKKWMAKKLGKKPEDVVLEPKLRPIDSEAFKGLCRVTQTNLFTTTIYCMLQHVMDMSLVESSGVLTGKLETFLSTALHLTLIATIEDETVESIADSTRSNSFVTNACSVWKNGMSIVHLLNLMWTVEALQTCRSKIKHIVKLFNTKSPTNFQAIIATMDRPFSDANLGIDTPTNADSDFEAKKKQAMERKAKIMAQMQAQQKSFMINQGLADWADDDMSDVEDDIPTSTESRSWKFPSGVCIQCREETNDQRFY
ncbi:E3 ubiquitin-protein ligase ubr1, partial [Elasticomyces elasticus]